MYKSLHVIIYFVLQLEPFGNEIQQCIKLGFTAINIKTNNAILKRKCTSVYLKK